MNTSGHNPRKKPRHLEDDLQGAVAAYLTLAYPSVLFFHVPNGGRRNVREAARLKRMGVRPGVADLLLFWQDKQGEMQGGAIELKANKNKQSGPQEVFMAEWQDLGGHYAVCRSIEGVHAVLTEWGVPSREARPC